MKLRKKEKSLTKKASDSGYRQVSNRSAPDIKSKRMDRLACVTRNKKKSASRAESTPTRGRKPIEFDDDELRDLLAGELLAVCVGVLKEHGLSVQRILQLARKVTKCDDGIAAATRLFQDVSDLGQLVSEWAENPAYVDSVGRPKVLPISDGRCSFGSLVRKYFNARSVAEILQLGCTTRVMEQVGPGRVGHLGACVLLTGNPLMLLGHAVRSIRWFLGTARYNAQAQQSIASTWPERQTFTELPEDEFQEFLKFMREPIINLTEMSNRWLMARATWRRPDTRTRKVMMGVQAYVFRDT